MISFDIERDLYKKDIIMIGVDEAGRGSWAGPLVSTACWFDFTKYKSLHSEINDSKKLKSSKRREIILSLENFVKYSSSIASVKEIDKYGLSYANNIAMKRSIFSLTIELKKNSEIYNCGYGEGYSVKQVVLEMEKILKHSLNKEIGRRREGDIPYSVADTTKFKKEFDWNPKYNSLNYILKTALEWEKIFE